MLVVIWLCPSCRQTTINPWHHYQRCRVDLIDVGDRDIDWTPAPTPPKA